MPEMDPQALEDYRNQVREALNLLEDELIPMLENGQPLGRMPAFGQLDDSETARTNYTTFHQGTWDNLQDLREAMHGMIKTLTDSGKLTEETDEVTGADFDGALDGKFK